MAEWKKNTPSDVMKEQGKKLEADMMAWFAKNKNAIVDNGNPLGKNTRMTSEGAKPQTNDLNFYNVVEAESVEDVIAMHKDNPHLQIPTVFLDLMEVPHMGQ